MRSLGFSCLGLEGDDPGIFLCFGHGLKVVLVAVETEAEVVEVALNHVGYMTLL